jgi:hypothetical protein
MFESPGRIDEWAWHMSRVGGTMFFDSLFKIRVNPTGL